MKRQHHPLPRAVHLSLAPAQGLSTTTAPNIVIGLFLSILLNVVLKLLELALFLVTFVRLATFLLLARLGVLMGFVVM